MIMLIEPYPLYWPEGKPFTDERRKAKFKTSFAQARDGLIEEIQRFGGDSIVITTDVAVRRDGLPYANQPEPQNPGVAVWFWRDGKLICFCCDEWNAIRDNMQALRKTVEYMRAIQRWGSHAMMEQAVEAFAYLPDGRSSGTAMTIRETQ